MQLAVAHVIGGDWLVRVPEKGPAIYYNAEDDDRCLGTPDAAWTNLPDCT
jgi:hypothetical protein